MVLEDAYCSSLNTNVYIPLYSCATALVLLAEEEATTIVDAEKKFRQALKIAEANFKRSQALQHHSPPHEKIHSKSYT